MTKTFEMNWCQDATHGEALARIAAENAAKAKGTTVRQLELEDQANQVNEMQIAINNAGRLMEAISFDRFEPSELHAITYFAAMALETLHEGLAEQASVFAIAETTRLSRKKACANPGNVPAQDLENQNGTE